MFDIGYSELLLTAIVALLVLGPEKLPGAMRTTGLWVGRIRRSFDRIKQELEAEVGLRGRRPRRRHRRGTHMKQSILVAALLALATPAHAQLGGLLNKAQQVKDAKGKFDDLNVTEEALQAYSIDIYPDFRKLLAEESKDAA